MPEEEEAVAPAFADPRVQAVFDRYEPVMQSRLLHLRAMIFQVAADLGDVGPLEETLKWGEPSYLTTESGSGTTIRINRDGKRAGGYALYVNCQTSLVEGFRQAYGDQLAFGGNRAVLLHVDEEVPEEILRHCIAMALTYHRDRKNRLRP